MPRGDCRGEERAKITGKGLTEDAVREIRASDRPYRELGKRYGVSEAMICHIRKGRKWRSVVNIEA